MCKTKRESNTTPRTSQPFSPHGSDLGCWPGPRATQRRFGVHGPTTHPRDLCHRRLCSTPNQTPTARLPFADPGWVWWLQASQLVPFPVDDQGPRGRRRVAGGCPVLQHSFRAEPGYSAAARELSLEVEVTGCLANIKPRKLKRSSRIIK